MTTRANTREIFRVFGALALVGAVLVMAVMSTRAVVLRNRGVDLLRLWPLAAWLVVAGVGNLRSTRWGAALLSVPLAAFFLFGLIGTLAAGAYLATVMMLVCAPILLPPIALTVRRWSGLARWW